MLERRKKEAEEEETKGRNFGFIPGTTLHSSYVNKSYDQEYKPFSLLFIVENINIPPPPFFYRKCVRSQTYFNKSLDHIY